MRAIGVPVWVTHGSPRGADRRGGQQAVQRLDVEQCLVRRDGTREEVLKNVFDKFNNQMAFGSF